MKKFFNTHREPLMLALRCAITMFLFVTALVNYRRLTTLDMRALVDALPGVWTAVAVILGVFAIKSMLFIVPASMIYISVGMAFSPVVAIFINLAGITLEVLLTYLLGRFLGGSYVEKRLRGKKSGEKVLALQEKKTLPALFVIRALPVFPIDFVSLLLGATKLPVWKYMLVSVLGIMPRVILFTILGDAIYDVIPMNIIVLVIVCCIPLLVIFWVVKYLLKRKKERGFALERPGEQHREQALEYLTEFEADGSHPSGGGGIHRFPDYGEWLQYEQKCEDFADSVEGEEPCQTFFYVRKSDGRIIGMVNLRFELPDDLPGGHIAYSVRPCERRHGYATMMLSEALKVYRERGFKRVLVACMSENAAGAGVIKNNSGSLESETDTPEGKLLRFWIEP